MFENFQAPAGYRFAFLPETGSTNDEALARGAGWIIAAGRQTAGRGRMGRPFPSEEGGLYFSVALKPAGPLKEAYYGLRAAAALCVAKALGGEVKIAWPCDIMSTDEKLGGVLCEAKDGVLAIGFGLRPQAMGTALSPEKVMADTVRAMAEAAAGWPENQAVLLQDYCDRCVTLMKFVDVTYRGMPLYGFAFAVDRMGGLMVMTQESHTVVTVYSGDAVPAEKREGEAPAVPPAPRV